MRAFYRRISVQPFECLIGFLAFISSFLAIIHFGNIGADALTLVLPHWLTVATNWLYLLTGIALVAGIGLARPDIEIAGLVGLAVGVIVRSIVLFQVAGFSAAIATSLFFNAVVVVACVIRTRILVAGDAVVRVRSDRQ